MPGLNKGEYGEGIAEGYLKNKGYGILEKRYRCHYGEIDIIARKNETVAFIEVKLRKTQKSGLAAESVTKSKQRSIIRTALHYIAKSSGERDIYRFDVIEVCGREFYDIRHIESAFYADHP